MRVLDSLLWAIDAGARARDAAIAEGLVAAEQLRRAAIGTPLAVRLRFESATIVGSAAMGTMLQPRDDARLTVDLLTPVSGLTSTATSPIELLAALRELAAASAPPGPAIAVRHEMARPGSPGEPMVNIIPCVSDTSLAPSVAITTRDGLRWVVCNPTALVARVRSIAASSSVPAFGADHPVGAAIRLLRRWSDRHIVNPGVFDATFITTLALDYALPIPANIRAAPGAQRPSLGEYLYSLAWRIADARAPKSRETPSTTWTVGDQAERVAETDRRAEFGARLAMLIEQLQRATWASTGAEAELAITDAFGPVPVSTRGSVAT